jgi:hypothetical protein
MVNTIFETPLPITFAAEVDHGQANAMRIQLFEDSERVGRRAEGAVELGDDDDDAPADGGQYAGAFRPVGKREGTRHAALDEALGDRHAFHHGEANDLLLLRREAHAFVGLLGGRNSEYPWTPMALSMTLLSGSFGALRRPSRKRRSRALAARAHVLLMTSVDGFEVAKRDRTSPPTPGAQYSISEDLCYQSPRRARLKFCVPGDLPHPGQPLAQSKNDVRFSPKRRPSIRAN